MKDRLKEIWLLLIQTPYFNWPFPHLHVMFQPQLSQTFGGEIKPEASELIGAVNLFIAEHFSLRFILGG